MADSFEAVYTEYTKGSLSDEALEQLDRSLRPSFIWLIFFCC